MMRKNNLSSGSSSSSSLTYEIPTDVSVCIFYETARQAEGKEITRRDALRQLIRLNNEEFHLGHIPNNQTSPLFRIAYPDLSENLLYDSFCFVYTTNSSWKLFYPDYQKGSWVEISLDTFSRLSALIATCTPATLDETKKQEITALIHKKDHTKLCYKILCNKIKKHLPNNESLADHLCANIHQAFYCPAAHFEEYKKNTYGYTLSELDRSLTINTTDLTITSHVSYDRILENNEERQEAEEESNSLAFRILTEVKDTNERFSLEAEEYRKKRELLVDEINQLKYELSLLNLSSRSRDELTDKLASLENTEKALRKNMQLNSINESISFIKALNLRKQHLFQEKKRYLQEKDALYEQMKSHPHDASLKEAYDDASNLESSYSRDYIVTCELEVSIYKKAFNLLAELIKSNSADVDIEDEIKTNIEELFSSLTKNKPDKEIKEKTFHEIRILLNSMSRPFHSYLKPKISDLEKKIESFAKTEENSLTDSSTLSEASANSQSTERDSILIEHEKLTKLRGELQAFFDATLLPLSDETLPNLVNRYVKLAAKLPRLSQQKKAIFDLTTVYQLSADDEGFKTEIKKNTLSINDEHVLEHPAFRPNYILANLSNSHSVVSSYLLLDFYHALNEPGFRLLKANEQTVFFELFIKKLNESRYLHPFPSLALVNCPAIDNRLFKKLLKAVTETASAPGLTHLTIINAPLLDQDAIEAIQDYCTDSLTHLHLEALTSSMTAIQTKYRCNAREFPKLTSLTLKNLSELTTLKLNSPELSNLIVENCPNLIVVYLPAENREMPHINKVFCALIEEQQYKKAVNAIKELTEIKTLSTLYAMIQYAQSGDEEENKRRTRRVLPLIQKSQDSSTMLGRHCCYALEKLAPSAVLNHSVLFFPAPSDQNPSVPLQQPEM